MSSDQCYVCAASVSPSASICPNCRHQLVIRDRYRLIRVLGQGGAGTVYEAEDLREQRRCAIKVVTSTSAAEQQLLEIEGDILRRYASTLLFIPDIYDMWAEAGQTYMVMEYIDGPTLDQVIERPWSAPRVEMFLRMLLTNLAALHRAGIIHRDLKPQNIKRTPDGRYVLLDFGVAKQGTATGIADEALSPAYAPPEQFQGWPTDARSDLYSLAATAYHLLTGHPLANATARQDSTPVQLPRGGTTPLESVLLRMLDLDPNNRPTDAGAALRLLDELEAAPSQPSRVCNTQLSTSRVGVWRGVLVTGAISVLLLVIGIAGQMRHAPQFQALGGVATAIATELSSTASAAHASRPVAVQVRIEELSREEMRQLAGKVDGDCQIYFEIHPDHMIIRLIDPDTNQIIAEQVDGSVWIPEPRPPLFIRIEPDVDSADRTLAVSGADEVTLLPGTYYRISVINNL